MTMLADGSFNPASTHLLGGVINHRKTQANGTPGAHTLREAGPAVARQHRGPRHRAQPPFCSNDHFLIQLTTFFTGVTLLLHCNTSDY